jgi:Amt family ammonium transporter
MTNFEKDVLAHDDTLASGTPSNVSSQLLSQAVLGRAVLRAKPQRAGACVTAALREPPRKILGMTRLARWLPCLLVMLAGYFSAPTVWAQTPEQPVAPVPSMQPQDVQIADPTLRQALAPLLMRNRQLEQQVRSQQQTLTDLAAQLSRSEVLLDETTRMVARGDKELDALRRQGTSLSTTSVKQEVRLSSVENYSTNNTVHLDRFWLLIAAALVFVMQAGFKCLEVGMVRPQHGNSVGMMNVLDFMVVSVVFFLFGFGFMFGDSLHGWIGASLFAPTVSSMESANPKFGLEFFMFQLGFAAVCATIVGGAVAERTGIIPYMLIAVFAGGVVYPIVGHWCWGVEFYSDPVNGAASGWLKQLGFVDFAGSTVVHSIGAWMSLWAIRQVGARRGRFNENGTPNDEPFSPYSLGYATLGVFLLWFGWWGFNGGSQLRYDLEVSGIVLNTNIGAAVGGLVAFFHAMVFDRERSYVKLLGGILGGLVAVTANCNQISPLGAIIIGAVAGLIHNFAYDWLLKRKLDDAVGAIPVHGACGVWGTLAVALFGNKLTMPWMQQLGVQLIGIVVVFVTVSAVSYAFFRLLDQLGMRVTSYEERHGFTVGSQERAAPALRAPELTRVVWTAEK